MPSEIKLDKEEGLKVIKRNSNQPDKFKEEKVKKITLSKDDIQKFNNLKED